MNQSNFRCLMVRQTSAASEESARQTVCEFTTCDAAQLKSTFVDVGQQPMVRIQLKYSSLNYKDALAIQGHPGVAKRLPLIPGIDGAGVVAGTTGTRFQVGDEVMIFHAQFGTEHHGAYSELAYVPESWVYALPTGMSLRQAMALGTGGFTAAQCVDELHRHQLTPDLGEIVVSGATGGVGIFAVKLLSKLGYRVVASTGKSERTDWLLANGASEVISREELHDRSDRPLLKSRWAGAVDTVGGQTLATIIRGTKSFGCVTACGLVGGTQLDVTVYPFILRGVTLQGIDTANITYERRAAIWEKLGGPWRLDSLDALITEVDLDGLLTAANQISAGQIAGRIVVRL